MMDRMDEATAQRANRDDWDREADDYQREHGEFLRDIGFVWSPEGLDEADARLLADVSGRRVLEVGCGAGQCARWLRTQGADVVGFDLSLRQLQHSHRIDEQTAVGVPVVSATVSQIPFADDSFDLTCSAFGALPFVLDIGTALREVARVTRPGGSFTFSVVHPVRRLFPDDPSEQGMTIIRSYFDRSPYVEVGDDGEPTYVEPHHTLSDWVAALADAGLQISRLIEPEWSTGLDRVWGGWGPLRGRYLPGTAIFSTTVS